MLFTTPESFDALQYKEDRKILLQIIEYRNDFALTPTEIILSEIARLLLVIFIIKYSLQKRCLTKEQKMLKVYCIKYISEVKIENTELKKENRELKESVKTFECKIIELDSLKSRLESIIEKEQLKLEKSPLKGEMKEIEKLNQMVKGLEDDLLEKENIISDKIMEITRLNIQLTQHSRENINYQNLQKKYEELLLILKKNNISVPNYENPVIPTKKRSSRTEVDDSDKIEVQLSNGTPYKNIEITNTNVYKSAFDGEMDMKDDMIDLEVESLVKSITEKKHDM